MNQPFKQPSKIAIVISVVLGLTACQQAEEEIITSTVKVTQQSASISTESAIAFLNEAEAELAQLSVEGARTEWVYSNFITEDTAAMSAAIGEKLTSRSVYFATEAAKYADVKLDQSMRVNFTSFAVA